MDEKTQELVSAVDAAMEAEAKARRFYLDARERATSPQGKDLLGQLADFEERHFNKLGEFKSSLTGGDDFQGYKGTGFQKPDLPPEGGKARETELNDVLDVLSAAIDAETEAHRVYSELAEKAETGPARDLFRTLAAEEVLHRRILSDEYYHLSNKDGIWTWGE
jgi:rubrerythrin